jgi:hypothetical protein
MACTLDVDRSIERAIGVVSNIMNVPAKHIEFLDDAIRTGIKIFVKIDETLEVLRRSTRGYKE